jgi:hypothetical protein
MQYAPLSTFSILIMCFPFQYFMFFIRLFICFSPFVWFFLVKLRGHERMWTSVVDSDHTLTVAFLAMLIQIL